MNMKTIEILACITFVLSSCNQVNKGHSNTDLTNDTILMTTNDLIKNTLVNKKKEKPIDKNNFVHDNPIKVDTIIGEYQISYIIQDNDEIISKQSIDSEGNSLLFKYADRSVFLSFKKKDKIILYNKEIRKKDFISIIPKEEISKYQLWFFQVKSVNNKGLIFSVNICMPDTDICYPIELFISNKGEFTMTEINEGEMGD